MIIYTSYGIFMWMIVAKIELVADFGPSIQYTHLFMDHFFSGVCEFSTISEGWLREPIWGVIFERSWIKISVAVWPFVQAVSFCGTVAFCGSMVFCGNVVHFVALWYSVALVFWHLWSIPSWRPWSCIFCNWSWS